MLKDFSLASITAGFVAVLTGTTGSIAIIFQAAQSAGATAEQISSWLMALGIGMALTTILLSYRYKAPILTAWSTPGAALLVTSLEGISIHEAIGAFIACGILTTLSGMTGWFERVLNLVPKSLAAAMLGGILLQFGIDAFASLNDQLLLVLPMLCAYITLKRMIPRYTIVCVLLLGISIAHYLGLLQLATFTVALSKPIYMAPSFTVATLISVGLPLFIVTMTSQNIPGMATIRAAGYNPPISPLITWTGVSAVVFAVFGGFSYNLAAITAAICMGPEAHPKKEKRYTAALSAGFFYLLFGIFGATVVALFMAFPEALVMTIAGLSLLSTIGTSMVNALQVEAHREPALITFLVTASGIVIAGLGAAFWGLVAGVISTVVLSSYRKQASRSV